jgi:hypothetical protein
MNSKEKTMKTKIRKVICSCGDDTYEETFANDNNTFVWKCNNCGTETPRRYKMAGRWVHSYTESKKALEDFLGKAL